MAKDVSGAGEGGGPYFHLTASEGTDRLAGGKSVGIESPPPAGKSKVSKLTLPDTRSVSGIVTVGSDRPYPIPISARIKMIQSRPPVIVASDAWIALMMSAQ